MFLFVCLALLGCGVVCVYFCFVVVVVAVCLFVCLVLFCVKRRSDQQVPSAGTTLYSKIYAEDAAGHRSQVIVSDGVRVDTTPPVISSMVYSDGVNLIDNPSFENDPALNADLTQCDAQPPTSWEVRFDAQNTSYCVYSKDCFSFLSSNVVCDATNVMGGDVLGSDLCNVRRTDTSYCVYSKYSFFHFVLRSDL